MEHGGGFSGIGERVRAYRKSRGLTAAGLAAKSGVSENAIRKIESGNSKQPSFVTGVRIADALGLSPRILAFGEAARREEIPELASLLRKMRERRRELNALGVGRAAIFGSVARGDAQVSSDVDILIEPGLDRPFSIISLSQVAILLEEALGRRVDVITPRAIRSSRYANIADQAVYAF
ncbi:MAG: XRE family transcriptional regulator [Candidatus Eremiobacteraeota bacterium]|nr:XRE family transcriptional regulator [Candidatus Eremiobacteraeota bacterium]